MEGDVLRSYASLLIGGLFAFSLSGVLFVQCLIYFKMYPLDVRLRKAMVTVVWFLDTVHSTCILAALYDYFIKFFGNEQRVDHIPWPIALTVVVTAAQTLINHFFFINRIYRSSDNNYWIAAPIAILVIFRIAAACVSTSEMTTLARYSAFTHIYPGWVFTLGLSLSVTCDVLITGWLCYFLFRMRERVNKDGMVKVVDRLTLYTMENGALTCVVTTISLICWLTMPTNIVFLGLHFVIGKLYANSLLAALNTRKVWRRVQIRFGRTKTMQTTKEISFPVLTTTAADVLTLPDAVYQRSVSTSDPTIDNRHWHHHHDDPEEEEEVSDVSSPSPFPPRRQHSRNIKPLEINIPRNVNPDRHHRSGSETTPSPSKRLSTSRTAFPELRVPMRPGKWKTGSVSWRTSGEDDDVLV